MEVKILHNVNTDLLPTTIKIEFNKIYLEFRGVKDDSCFVIESFDYLHQLHLQGKLFENEENEDHLVLLTDEKLNIYKKKYHEGFRTGYNTYNNFLHELAFNDNDNSIRINRVFSGIYNKYDQLRKPILIDTLNSNQILCVDSHFYEYGVMTGTFIKCWDIVLNNFQLFKNIFDQHHGCELSLSNVEIEGFEDNKNPFSDIFNGDDNKAYKIFKDLADDVIDCYLDYSFIFQQMIGKSENLIRKRYPHKFFMEWMLNNEFISNNCYTKLFEMGSFSKKANSPARLARYYSIKKRHIPANSD